MQNPSLMIFAAGFGTRMGPLTQHQPKPMVQVAGLPLIDHALRVARAAGVGKIVINLHYLGAQIAAHLAGQDVIFAHEAQILETGGGLKAALPLLGQGPVLLLNSDAVWQGENPLTALLAAWRPDEMDALLLLTPPERALGHAGRGDFILGQDGRISRAKGQIAPIYLGAQIMQPDLVRDYPETVFSLGRIWDVMIARQRAFGLIYGGKWCDVGTPDGVALAERMLDV